MMNSAPAELDVHYVAQLARIALSEEEVEKFQSQLGDVLHYMEKLEDLDLDGIEPTAHANPIFDVMRSDQSRPGLPQEKALQNAPRQVNELIIVPKVIE